MLSQIIAVGCLLWYFPLGLVCVFGWFQIFRHYRQRSPPAETESLPLEAIPHVTVIRPIKGIEPDLYECLASTLQQTYPKQKLTTFFCISSRHDPALPIVTKVLEDFAEHDAQLLIEDDDELLRTRSGELGPNPKIRNMSRAYREAKGDIVWIIDCNVWVGKGVAGRMVDTLCGVGKERPYKFVHQLPVAIDITKGQNDRPAGLKYSTFGGLLEELFLSSSHAKFYTAINTVALAPCIVGKSNMFRRSHLAALTQGLGVDYFSSYICEDHLIGDLLWKQPMPANLPYFTPEMGNHCMLFGDLAVQPVANMSPEDYIARRGRWLRVRKLTVLAATFVEPGTESFLCSIYGAYGMTKVEWFYSALGIPQTWTAFALLWLLSISIWATADWFLYEMLQGMRSTEVDANTPWWARGPRRRPFLHWLAAWLGRETLALPIWTWAVWGGMTVDWRGRKFRVAMDMKVRALDETEPLHDMRNGNGNGRTNGHGYGSQANGKRRLD